MKQSKRRSSRSEMFQKTDAQEACREISSTADIIAAQYKGAKDIIDAAYGLLTPNNYKSGDNTSKSLLKNIINQDLSINDIYKIKSDCINSSVGSQVNDLDLSGCKFCEKNPCPLNNITQVNIDKSDQTCTMQSAIQALTSKKASADAQAAAKTIQKAQDQLSGSNVVKQDNCNILDQDMSSNQYFEALSNCSNTMAVDQSNRIKACGGATDIIQQNKSQRLQDCKMAAGVSAVNRAAAEAKAVAESESDQTTIAGGAAAGGSSSISCCCCLSSILALYAYSQYSK